MQMENLSLKTHITPQKMCTALITLAPTFIGPPAYPIDLATPKYNLTTGNNITPPPTLLQHPHPLFYLIKPPTTITPITHPYFTPSLHPLLNPITHRPHRQTLAPNTALPPETPLPDSGKIG